MTKDEAARRLYFRVYHLPAQLERARARVRQLEAEAARYGMSELLAADELLEGLELASAAFDAECRAAR